MTKARSKASINVMAEIGIMAAAGFILDAVSGMMFKGLFPNGGSISIAMICILLIAFRRGFWPALSVGLIMGVFDLMNGPFMIASSPDRVFFQVFLDYVAAYPLVSLAALMKKPFDKAKANGKGVLFLALGAIIGGMAKLLSHYLAGVLFWADPSGFAWELSSMNPYLYCLLYNFAYTGPSIVISGVLIILVFKRAPHLFTVRKAAALNEEAEVRRDNRTLTLSIITGVAAFALTLTYLIRYILSYVREDYGEDGSQISFDRVSLLLFIVGAVAIIFSAISYQNARNRYDYKVYPLGLMGCGIISMLAGLSQLLRAYIKGKDPTLFWVWIGVSLVIAVGALAYFFYLKNKQPKASKEISEQPQ